MLAAFVMMWCSEAMGPWCEHASRRGWRTSRARAAVQAELDKNMYTARLGDRAARRVRTFVLYAAVRKE